MEKEQLSELQQAVKQTKRTVKGLMGQMRVTTQFLADLEERLDQALAAGRLEPTAQEAQHDHERQKATV
jgi:hypothetical protein